MGLQREWEPGHRCGALAYGERVAGAGHGDAGVSEQSVRTGGASVSRRPWVSFHVEKAAGRLRPGQSRQRLQGC